jgi:hypothetical protein
MGVLTFDILFASPIHGTDVKWAISGINFVVIKKVEINFVINFVVIKKSEINFVSKYKKN